MAGERDYIKIDGKNFDIPAWASESTLKSLTAAVGRLAESMGKADDSLENSIKGAADGLRDGTMDLDESIADFAIKTSSLIRQMGKDIGGAMLAAAEAAGDKLFSFAGGLLKSGAVALFGALGLNIASIKDTFDELKASFGELSKVGLNLSAGFGENLSMGTKDVMNEFLNMGLNMQELTGIMTSNSFAMAANRKTFTTTAKTFASLNKSGAEYGLTVAESNQMLADELDFKSRMLFQDQIDADQAAEQADTLFSQQMNYTKLLGKSIEEIRKSAQDVLKGSSSAMSLIALQGKVGTKTLDGLNSFASGLIASGATEDFTSALLEAGTGIDMFAHEATRQAFTTLSAAGVDMFGAMSKFRSLTESGGLDVDAAAEQVKVFRDQLAGMSEQGLEQLRYMAAAGDASAQQMISMVVSAKQAKKSAEDLAKTVGMTPEATSKSLLEIDTAFSQIKGAFTQFRQSMAISLLPAIKFIAKTLANPDIRNALVAAGEKISKFISGITDPLAEITDDKVKGTVDNIVRFINSASDTVVDIIKFLKDAFSSEGNGESSIATSVANFTGNLIENIFTGLWAAISNTLGSADFWKVMATAFLAVGGGALVLGLGLKMLGGASVLKGALALGLVGGAIWLSADAMEKFSSLDYGQVWKGIGTLTALTMAVWGFGLSLIGPQAIAFAAGVAALMGLGIALRLIPMDQLAGLNTTLGDFGNLNLDNFTNLADALEILAESIGTLSVAAAGGAVETVKSWFTGNKKTPIGYLADDLERLAKISSTMPPVIMTGAGATGAAQTLQIGSPQSAAAAAAAQTSSGAQSAQPFMTKDQELLDSILSELKKSVTALKKIQETAQNSAT